MPTPSSVDFEIYIERAELAFESYTKYSRKDPKGWNQIYKNGSYKANKAHSVSKGTIKKHIKNGGFKSGGTYEIQVEQEIFMLTACSFAI